MHAVDPATSSAPNATSIGDLAQDTSAYVRAWSTLVASETRLAGTSVVRLAFAALVIPALALVICIIVNALLVSVLNRWVLDWSSSIAIVLLLNLAGLAALLFAMRRWWRNLSLPRSRGALVQLLQRIS
jgi:multisubunit Na+/H+ antiporter MnhB subunit